MKRQLEPTRNTEETLSPVRSTQEDCIVVQGQPPTVEIYLISAPGYMTKTMLSETLL